MTINAEDHISVLKQGGVIIEDDIADGAVATAKLAADAIDGTKLADNAVSLEHLDSGITPSHITVFAGEVTTTGGDATEVETVTGALASDIVIVTLQTEGATPVTLDAAAVTADTITCTFSADPSTDHVWAYQVLRAAA